MKAGFALAFAGILVSACTLSLAGDITPPPESPNAQSLSSLEFPAAGQDFGSGADIYAENCAPCHGVSGLGDGVQAPQLPFPPSALADPEVAREGSPAEWYRLISSGNLERLMPPFEGSLSIQQRWDVLAYAYSLSWDTDRLSQGEQIFVDHRQQLEDNNIAPTNLEQTAYLTQSDLAEQIRSVLPELSADESETLAEYVQARALGYAGPHAIIPVSDSPTETGSFHGQITNGSGAKFQEGITVTLRGFDQGRFALTETTMAGSDGAFLFEDIPLVKDRTYFVQVDYDGLFYFSDLVTVEDDISTFTLPVTVFETTSDISQLVIEYVHLVFQFPQPGLLRVVEQVSISNLGNRAVAPTPNGQPVLRFSLPSGSSNLQFNDGALGDRYVAVKDGFGDLRAVLPGEETYQILFAYDLAYGRNVNLKIPVDLPTRSVIAFVPESAVGVTSPSFQPIGSQIFESKNYLAFAIGAIDAGDVIDLELSGRHPLGQPGFAADPDLLFGLGALTAAVGAAWLWLRSLPETKRSSLNQLIDQIIKLDARFEHGQLNKADYKRQRSSLKKQLKNAMGTQK